MFFFLIGQLLHYCSNPQVTSSLLKGRALNGNWWTLLCCLGWLHSSPALPLFMWFGATFLTFNILSVPFEIEIKLVSPAQGDWALRRWSASQGFFSFPWRPGVYETSSCPLFPAFYSGSFVHTTLKGTFKVKTPPCLQTQLPLSVHFVHHCERLEGRK